VSLCFIPSWKKVTMSHVTEKLAEFIFEELPAPEMAEATRHLSECPNCREQVDRFQQTLAMLKAAPDLEPPRHTVFEFEQPRLRRLWRWFPAATAVAGLLVMTIALAGRLHVQWHDSQLTVAFGQAIPTAQTDPAGELATEIQRMKGHLAYLESQQQRVERNTTAIAAALEPIARAQRSSSGD
jgi:predicted anti-sigma-YlaC factor YlaD